MTATPSSALPTLQATRYVQPLREGGSLPAVMETADGGLWVVKFRGAGQGPKVLVSELIVGLLARAAGLPAPDLALVVLAADFGRTERDTEIRELLQRSEGVNVGLRYLDGAFNFDPSAAGALVTPELAARVVWLDAFVTNMDRTHRNPNLMVHARAPWLIDNGAALYAHHDWATVDDARTRTPFALIKDHILLDRAAGLAAADAFMAAAVAAALEPTLAAVPDVLLESAEFESPAAARERYRVYLYASPGGPTRVRGRSRARTRPARARAEGQVLGSPVTGMVSYDFAVLRLVPHAHLGAFVPVGVAVHSRTERYLALRTVLGAGELARLAPGVDAELLDRYLASCRAMCAGESWAGPVALAPTSERFHWLTAPRSDVLQCSPVHGGLCTDPAIALDRLFDEYVGHSR